MSGFRRLVARRLHQEQEGMTLIEVMVSTVLMVVVMAIFAQMLFAVLNGVGRQQIRSMANDRAREAISDMDGEIRSGNVLYNPATEPVGACGGKDCATGYNVRVLTQANAPTRTPTERCIQWVIDGGTLWKRAWAVGAASSLSGWRAVADHVVNRNLSPQVPAFALDPTPGSRVLNITLMVNPKLGGQDAPRTLRLNTSIAIRNTGVADPCSPSPAS